MAKKEFFINLLSRILTFFINLGITFFLTPFIITNVGSEAFGFVSLANNFIGYIQVITVALNSLAGRYITIKIYKEDIVGANKYFVSVLLVNIIFSTIILIFSSLFIFFLDKFIKISQYLVLDVKILWFFILFSFVLSLISSTFGIATFITNKLYLSSLREFFSQIIKTIVILFFLLKIKKSIWVVGLGTFISMVYILLWNIKYSKKLLPFFEYRISFFDWDLIKEILSTGIWNSISKISQVLSTGLDLLLTNIFINNIIMGQFAIGKTVPNALVNLIGTVSGTFSPKMTILYAQSKREDLTNYILFAMKIATFFSALSSSLLVLLGKDFYSLWVPNEKINMIYNISLLSSLNTVITGTINPLYNVFTLTNKVKQNSIAMIIYGVSSFLGTFILLKTTNLGVYVIAGVSAGLGVVLALIFHIPYSAKYLGLNKKTFFPPIFQSIYYFIIITVVGFLINRLFSINSWTVLFIRLILITIISIVIFTFIFLKKEEWKKIINIVRRKLSVKR